MKIRTKLILSFLTISMCGILVVGYFSFNLAKDQLMVVRSEKLTALAFNQKKDLQNTLIAWKDRVNLISSRTQLRLTFIMQMESPSEKHIKKMKRILKDALGSVRKVERISLHSLTGQKIVDVGEAQVPSQDSISSKKLKKVFLDSIWMDESSNTLFVRLVGPIQIHGRKIGVIKVVLKADELMDIVNNYNGLGKTGETMLARKDSEGRVQYLNPLRFEANKGLKFRASTQEDNVVVNAALSKKEEFLCGVDLVDYRGVSVLAATAYIPELDWGIVVKIDRKEVFEAINELHITIIGLVFVIFIFVSFAAFYISNLITRPIIELSHIEEKIREGDLTQRAKIHSKDEVGHLAETFNSMMSALSDKTVELEEFVFRSAHDLRSPLVSCIGLLNFIETDVKEGDKERALESLKFIKNALSESQTLISDLLALTKLKSSEEPMEGLDIKGLIEAALNKFQHMDNFDRLEIQKEINFDQLLFAKKSRVLLIIDNLISNAIKYQDPEEGTSFIRISVFQDGEFFVLQVLDNGLGIPKEQQDKIFTMFKRFHPSTSFGSGLGLYMMKKSADILKGTISYEDIGNGSSFTLRIPCITRDPS